MKKLKSFWRLVLPVLLLGCFAGIALGDAIILKNGRRIEADIIWRENGMVKARLYGAELGYPESEVLKIEGDGDDSTGRQKLPNPFDPFSLRKNSAKRSASPQKPPLQNGFSFDVWRSGMDVQTIMDTAERNDLPLTRRTLAAVTKHFDPKIRKIMYQLNEFQYRQRLMGYPANIILHLTPEGKLLYKIEILWGSQLGDKADKEAFFAEIKNVLAQKYGRARRGGRELFMSERVFWRKKEDFTVILEKWSGYFRLTYIDYRLESSFHQETQDLRQEKLTNSAHRDGAKF
jgi:hypothetical protein